MPGIVISENVTCKEANMEVCDDSEDDTVIFNLGSMPIELLTGKKNKIKDNIDYKPKLEISSSNIRNIEHDLDNKMSPNYSHIFQENVAIESSSRYLSNLTDSYVKTNVPKLGKRFIKPLVGGPNRKLLQRFEKKLGYGKGTYNRMNSNKFRTCNIKEELKDLQSLSLDHLLYGKFSEIINKTNIPPHNSNLSGVIESKEGKFPLEKEIFKNESVISEKVLQTDMASKSILKSTMFDNKTMTESPNEFKGKVYFNDIVQCNEQSSRIHNKCEEHISKPSDAINNEVTIEKSNYQMNSDLLKQSSISVPEFGRRENINGSTEYNGISAIFKNLELCKEGEHVNVVDKGSLNHTCSLLRGKKSQADENLFSKSGSISMSSDFDHTAKLESRVIKRNSNESTSLNSIKLSNSKHNYIKANKYSNNEKSIRDKTSMVHANNEIQLNSKEIIYRNIVNTDKKINSNKICSTANTHREMGNCSLKKLHNVKDMLSLKVIDSKSKPNFNIISDRLKNTKKLMKPYMNGRNRNGKFKNNVLQCNKNYINSDFKQTKFESGNSIGKYKNIEKIPKGRSTLNESSVNGHKVNITKNTIQPQKILSKLTEFNLSAFLFSEKVIKHEDISKPISKAIKSEKQEHVKHEIKFSHTSVLNKPSSNKVELSVPISKLKTESKVKRKLERSSSKSHKCNTETLCNKKRKLSHSKIKTCKVLSKEVESITKYGNGELKIEQINYPISSNDGKFSSSSENICLKYAIDNVPESSISLVGTENLVKDTVPLNLQSSKDITPKIEIPVDNFICKEDQSRQPDLEYSLCDLKYNSQYSEHAFNKSTLRCDSIHPKKLCPPNEKYRESEYVSKACSPFESEGLAFQDSIEIKSFLFEFTEKILNAHEYEFNDENLYSVFLTFCEEIQIKGINYTYRKNPPLHIWDANIRFTLVFMLEKDVSHLEDPIEQNKSIKTFLDDIEYV